MPGPYAAGTGVCQSQHVPGATTSALALTARCAPAWPATGFLLTVANMSPALLTRLSERPGARLAQPQDFTTLKGSIL